jgi:hypothetical protein
MDGQRAEPGEMYGWTAKPKGGMLGAADWLIAHRQPGDILLITANNLAHDSGGTMLRDAVLAIGKPPASYAGSASPALRADAVAFGIDDFLRGLKQGGQAGTLYQALRDPAAPPFVISNGIVRIRKKHLNRIEGGGFHLHVPRDESVDWARTLAVTCDPCPNVTATLREESPLRGRAIINLDITADQSFQRMTLTVPHGLHPDSEYQLTIAPYGRRATTLTFRTHLALAPLTGSVPPGLTGLPIRYVARGARVTAGSDVDPTCGVQPANMPAPILIVGMADPTADSRSGDEMWSWEGGSCPIGSCEFDFLPPLDAFEAIKAWTKPDDDCTPPPVFALMSGLTEVQMQPVITQYPEIRWVIVDYDSRVLGQHRGRDAIVNPGTLDTTQLWARPQWVGSSVVTLAAEIVWRPRTATTRTSPWELTNASVHSEIVEGRALKWKIEPQTGRPPAITYFPENDPGTTIAGPLGVYPAFPGMLNRKTSQGRLWTSIDDMAAFVLDIMRSRGHADLAVLPGEFVDGDTMAWLESEYGDGTVPLDWLSRFVAARVFYREEQMVIVEVPGSRLVDVINGVIETEHRRFGEVYGAGFGTSGTLPILSARALELNDRRLNPDHFYRVAMPQSVAEEQALPSHHVVLTSILDEIDDRMTSANGARAATSGSLGEQLEAQFARRAHVYMSATPARVDFAQETVEEGNPGVFSKIPLEGRSAQPQELWGFAGQAELGVDYRSFAYKVTGEATFTKQTIANTITYPTDEWTAGFRTDWKLQRIGIRRVFAGLFRQSWFSDHVADTITPVRFVQNAVDPETGLRITEVIVNGPSVTPEISRPVFNFLRTGVDLEDSGWKALTLKGVAVSLDYGQVERDRDSVRISGGEPIPLDEMYRLGLAALLNDAFDRNPAGFAANPTVAFGYADHTQSRLQIDGGFEFGPSSSRIHWVATGRFRRYFDEAGRGDFTPNTSLLVRSALEWTIVRRIKAGPFIDYYRVDAKGADGPFIDRKLGFAFEIPLHIALKPGVWMK